MGKYQKSEIIAGLKADFVNYSISGNAITITSPENLIITYLPNSYYIESEALIMSYIEERKISFRGYSEPYLSSLLKVGDKVVVTFNSGTSGFNKRIVKGSIISISITPDKNYRYPVEIELKQNNVPLNHGLKGTAYYH